MHLLKLLLIFLMFNPLTSFAAIKNINICDDDGEWPPYLYFERKDGKKTDKLVGYTVELIDKIMKENKITYNLKVLPWKRCLENVKNYQEDFALLLQFSTNEQRMKDYYLTKTIYETHGSVFYSKKNHPKGLTVEKLEDLKKYKACGLSGYNYALYGFKDTEVDTGTRTFDKLIEKVKEKKCDIFNESFEVLAGFKKTGELDLSKDSEIVSKELTMIKPTTFHMAVTKSEKFPEGKELLKIIDDGITKADKDGTLASLRKKWIEN